MYRERWIVKIYLEFWVSCLPSPLALEGPKRGAVAMAPG